MFWITENNHIAQNGEEDELHEMHSVSARNYNCAFESLYSMICNSDQISASLNRFTYSILERPPNL